MHQALARKDLESWATAHAIPDDILEAFELLLEWYRDRRTGVFRTNFLEGSVRYFGEDGTRLPRARVTVKNQQVTPT